MEKIAENKICSSVCFFKPSLLVLAILVPGLVFTCFLTFGFSPYLVTIPILFLSTLFIVTFPKKRVSVVENPAQGDASPLSRPNRLVIEKGVGEKPNDPEFETVSQNSNSAAQQSQVFCMHDEYQVETTDFPSDSESSDDFSVGENLELSWVCSNNVSQNVAISDGSVSDDDDEEDDDGDDLIEISLPKNSSVGSNVESKQKLQSDLPESIFMQEGLMEQLADINEANEEENLIEIDLSMGSIKCSTFEIEAGGSRAGA